MTPNKNAIIFILSFVFFYGAFAQKKALTETGEEVILHENGTWSYINKDSQEAEEYIPLLKNETVYSKNNSQSFLVKSLITNVGINLDPKKWKFVKSDLNDASEYDFESKDGNFYATMITEKIEIPLDQLKNIAFNNAKEVSENMKIISQDYRQVNGVEVIAMEMKGIVQGINLTYFSYYFSNNTGSVQLITFSSSNIMESYKSQAEEFLNGFVVVSE